MLFHALCRYPSAWYGVLLLVFTMVNPHLTIFTPLLEGIRAPDSTVCHINIVILGDDIRFWQNDYGRCECADSIVVG